MNQMNGDKNIGYQGSLTRKSAVFIPVIDVPLNQA